MLPLICNFMITYTFRVVHDHLSVKFGLFRLFDFVYGVKYMFTYILCLLLPLIL